ncbi:Protein of unknown function precursor containing Sel1 domains and a C-terminal secretion signal [Tenacibaculum maritimum]|uniref:T9SS type A sorting domain-containing protein n=1 Tax=Tenacibaculum maritimum TaxID=107401 RepID=UPI0012E5BE17|nr:T9SS type A sorting domain-containing protein [Tenacibaculum maritimum]CAA0194300.1 Protein of unknown function precursor containing Sel1 domains and a C-terminal secretion signal [Tenacibaculum maritimum]CAA0239105.1 Protein of unknown function precursor containing Sel1 domains and a C-terminal secretion signal [Tenacibaculum maritimum]
MRFVKIAWIILCFSVVTVKAQEQKGNCEKKLKKALYLLKEKKGINESIKLLLPCAEIGNPTAQLLLGRIYIVEKGSLKKREGFKLVKKSAKQGNSLAASYLGDLFKYGIGTPLNYKKAKKWYKRSHELGNPKGTYSLGYMYFKGLGNGAQNYEKAVQLFTQTNYPMAKHWLAVAYYFGYGVGMDKDRALSILEENKVINSDIMLDCMKQHFFKDFNLKNDYVELVNSANLLENNLNTKDINGKWKGVLIQMDWSGKKIMKELPIEAKLKYREGKLGYNINLGSNSLSGVAFREENNAFSFEDLYVNLERDFFNEESEKKINYQIIKGTIRLKESDKKRYLIFELDNYAHEIREPGGKLYMILSEKEEITENGIEVSEEVLEELYKMEDKFVKLYPNPFTDALFISYSLSEDSIIKLEVASIESGFKKVLEPEKKQVKGAYIYYLGNNDLKKGVYVVTVYVNGERKTETIVKK